jgi:hypothetical protein
VETTLATAATESVSRWCLGLNAPLFVHRRIRSHRCCNCFCLDDCAQRDHVWDCALKHSLEAEVVPRQSHRLSVRETGTPALRCVAMMVCGAASPNGGVRSCRGRHVAVQSMDLAPRVAVVRQTPRRYPLELQQRMSRRASQLASIEVQQGRWSYLCECDAQRPLRGWDRNRVGSHVDAASHCRVAPASWEARPGTIQSRVASTPSGLPT